MEGNSTSVLQIAVEPSGDTLPHFHEFVHALVVRRLRATTAQSVATAATELLDNAMAYATMASDIKLAIAMDTLRVQITVSNETVGTRIRLLERRIEELKHDPEGAYMQEMRRLTGTDGARTSARSMMGLARVRHEARMDLSLEVEGSRVTLVASRRR